MSGREAGVLKWEDIKGVAVATIVRSRELRMSGRARPQMSFHV